MRRYNASAFTLLLVALAGCGGGSHPDAGAGDPVAACNAVAMARCAKYDECSNGMAIAHDFGSMDACISRYSADCVASLTSTPMTTNTPASEQACAAGIGAQSCADWRDGRTPTACVPSPGPLANGTACVANSQCQSTVCLVPRDGQCGVCSPQPMPGDDCSAHSNCGRDLVCRANATNGTYTCRATVQAGGTCDADHPCASSLACVKSASTDASGTCQPAVNSVGGACHPNNIGGPDCDGFLGLFCNAMNQCAAVMTATAGQACGQSTDRTSNTFCTNASTCPPSTVTPRNCVARSTDGQPCDTAVGPDCITPARCVLASADGGTAGTCLTFSPTACP
jgi:hypothetical protein